MPGAGAWKARNLVALADTKGERTDKTALAEAAKGKSASSPGISLVQALALTAQVCSEARLLMSA